MVVCIVALIVFGILSIFSAKHRPLAKEAFGCMLRTVTLRPCNTGLDKRFQMIVSMKLMKHHQGLGKFVHAHFKSIANAFMLLFLLSIMFSGIGLFNLWVYGNCNGPDSSELCLLNTETYSNSNPLGFLFPSSPEQVKMVSYEGLPSKGTSDAEITIVEVGCFSCPFTKAIEPTIEEVMQKYEGKVELYLKYFPLPRHNYSSEASEAAECARDQGKFWEYTELLFSQQAECSQQPDVEELKVIYKQFAGDINLDVEQFSQCVDSGKYQEYVEQQKQESIDAGIYGTPTFFINGKVLVAPKTVEEFSQIIDAELQKSI
ncbi:MAG: thioredoxin domain-containing protein [Candidatus Diapherotrites archaeon]